MSESNFEATNCSPFREDLSEVALGVAEGRRRAEVLNHVGTCSQCAVELERLLDVTDLLIELAPRVEPPVGFESRVTRQHRGGRASPRHAHVHRRVIRMAASALLLVIVGFTLGILSRSSNAPATRTEVSSSVLTAHGRIIGRVLHSSQSPAWMYVMVKPNALAGPVSCQVVLANHRIVTVGQFVLTNGYDSWGVALASSLRDVRSARLVDAGGSIVAFARLST